MTRIFRFHIFTTVIVVLLACKEDSLPKEPIQNTEDKFTNPLLNAAPDPWVIQNSETYYFTHTTGNSLKLYRTTDLSNLSESQVKTVWTPPASGMNSKNIWAPEIHMIDDKWYFYYAADDGINENHRMWVLENAAADPFTGTWTDRGKLALADDKWAIDGTAFKYQGQLYFLWSGWEGDINVSQNIYISKMADPLTPTGERVMLSKPEYDWEKIGGVPSINEAPQFLEHGDKLFIIYSASGCWTDDYSLGMLTANAGADLMDPTAWTKSAEPVFTKNAGAQAYGPGHNSFFKSPDGTEDWMLYHANALPGQGCGNNRSTRMQKFTWNEDGTPNLGSPLVLGEKVLKPSHEN